MTRIAVVDNDPDLLDLVREIVAERGWATIPCQEVVSALAVIDREQPDVVLLDAWLDTPTSGFDLLQRLKDSPRTRVIPVIMCSAAIDSLSSREEWLRDRCIRVLPKPFEIEDLLQALDVALLPGQGVVSSGPPERTQRGGAKPLAC